MENIVYVGRAIPRMGLEASPLANPYTIKKTKEILERNDISPVEELIRPTSLRAYEWGLQSALERCDNVQHQEMNRLVNIAIKHGSLGLVCCCVGKEEDGRILTEDDCHAGIIKKFILKELKQ